MKTLTAVTTEFRQIDLNPAGGELANLLFTIASTVLATIRFWHVVLG